jgi:predicted ATPase
VELLGQILEQIPTAQVLLLLTFRPDFEPPWGARSNVTPVLMARFTHGQLSHLIRKAARGQDLPEEWVAEIVRRSDGVPLFAEELTRAVLESNPEPSQEGALHQLHIPETLQDALMARLDALGPAKELAQLGAVLGREFTYDLLLKVSPMQEQRLREALAEAVREELFYQRGTPPDSTYLFKHALLRDAAYQSLLRNTQRRHHLRVAETLVERLSGLASGQPELVAHHFSEAGDAERAIVYWERAGNRANRRAAYRESIGHLTRAIALLGELPENIERDERELRLQNTLGTCLIAAEGYSSPRVEEAYTRARSLCEVVQDSDQLASCLYGLAAHSQNKGDLVQDMEFGRQLAEIADRDDSPVYRVGAAFIMAGSEHYRGQFAAARACGEDGVAAHDRSQSDLIVKVYGSELGILTRAYLSWSLWTLGFADQAASQARLAAETARELDHPYTLAFSLTFDCAIRKKRGEREAAQALTEEIIAVSEAHGMPLFIGVGGIISAWCRSGTEIAVEEVKSAVAVAASTGNQSGATHIIGVTAEVIDAAGRHAEALGVIEMGLAVSKQFSMTFWDAELHRHKGELFLALDQHTEEEAEAEFQRALEIARAQEAKALELRAATSLARLWQRQGKKPEARELLAPIYDWFTEGFDTQDLKDAKALLVDLS